MESEGEGERDGESENEIRSKFARLNQVEHELE